MNPRELFEANLELIDRICSAVCRRNGCFNADAEDFTSQVKLKLLENDGARLTRFRGRSSLRTFLTTVIANLFRDYRNHKWGKWRPSAAAQRRGELAVQLESLLYRDGYTLDEAVAILNTNFQVTLPAADLRQLAEGLPARNRRRFESDEQLDQMPVDGGVEDGLAARDQAVVFAKSRAVLGEALSALPAEDRLVLKMRFENGFTVAHIARRLKVRQRRLYSRIESCRKQLLGAFEGAGMSAEEVLSTVGWDE